MKQILSVADFAMILNLVNQTMVEMERPIISNWREKDYDKKKKEHLEAIKQNAYYKSLMHLKQSLENLNIEVEVPDVEVKE